MITFSDSPSRGPYGCLKPGQAHESKTTDPAPHESQSDERRWWLCCKECGFPITGPEAAREMEGAHVHNFFNPAGLLFEIACFSNAPGCLVRGQPSSEFSWFSGYLWSYAACGRCACHLGWQFAHPAGDNFFGLIVNRLVQAEGGERSSDS